MIAQASRAGRGKMCAASEGMESKEVKWNIHRRMLIDGFIMWEQKWPEKATVMMYCLTIDGSGMWIQTAAFISPHLCARVSEHSLVSGAGAGRLMSPDMMYALSSCSLSITGRPRRGVMMMRAARTALHYFTMVKDNGPASYCAGKSAQASNYCR